MSKRVNRVSYTLDSKDVKELLEEEIRAILRGADDLIMTAGRNMLAKILKGSKDKKVLQLKLNESPVYGYFNNLTLENILSKIDWCIESGYLAIKYDYRLPMLAYTEKGWEIEVDIYSDELINKINEICFTKEYKFVEDLKDGNREIIWMLLDKIAISGKKQYIPVLKYWQSIEYKKVQKRINCIIRSLEGIGTKQKDDDKCYNF